MAYGTAATAKVFTGLQLSASRDPTCGPCPNPCLLDSLIWQGNWVTATLEAVVAWNTPKPYHPAAVAFINRSLDHWAGGHDKWHDRFTHHDKHHIERPLAQGVVMERKKREAQKGLRLPAAFYDTSAL